MLIDVDYFVHTSNKALTLSWRRSLSYGNRSIDLLCNQWTSFYMIGAPLWKSDALHPSYSESLLQSYRAEFAFLFFFSLSWFFFANILSRFIGQQRKREAISLYPFYHFHSLHRHSEIIRVIAAKSSPLHIANVVRRMLKTGVTLGNISRVWLNLIKRLISWNVQRLLSPPNVHTVNIYILSLVHQLLLLVALIFVPLPYLFG